MTKLLERPIADLDVESQDDLLTKTREMERELVPQLPTEPRRPTPFRWLGWLLGLVAVAGLTWVVIDRVIADDAATPASTEFVRSPGVVNSDPKLRTPAVTTDYGDALRSGQPGTVTLTEIVTFGNSRVTTSLEDATVYPAIYWAPRDVPDPNTQFMEEATVSPWIYHQIYRAAHTESHTYDY